MAREWELPDIDDAWNKKLKDRNFNL